MEILEYGNKEKPKIILIHGFESPYQIWEEYINYFKNDYHILIPILHGHNPNDKEEFISFEESAKEIENFIINKNENNIYAIYGMSMGGIVATILLQNNKLNIKNIILESTPLISYNNFLTSILTKQYLKLTHKAQKRDDKTIRQAINSIVPKYKLNYFLEMIDNITDKTIINYIKETGKYKLPKNINTENTNLYYFYGTKLNEILAKKSAKYIINNYKDAKIERLKNKGHCEDSIMNPKIMIEKLKNILN